MHCKPAIEAFFMCFIVKEPPVLMTQIQLAEGQNWLNLGRQGPCN